MRTELKKSLNDDTNKDKFVILNSCKNNRSSNKEIVEELKESEELNH